MKVAIGRKHGKWTILDSDTRRTASGHTIAMYLVRCECGTEKWTSQGSWGKSAQCAACKAFADADKSRSRSKHPLRGIWAGILSRCRHPGNSVYRNYGGRGIYVCDRWSEGVTGVCSNGDAGFANFVADMGPRPAGHSVERLDNDGPYAPDNCRWATAKEQCNNTRKNSVYGGNTMAQWCEILGITAGQLSRGSRVLGDLGAAVELVKSQPVESRRSVRWVPKENIVRRPRTKAQEVEPTPEQIAAEIRVSEELEATINQRLVPEVFLLE